MHKGTNAFGLVFRRSFFIYFILYCLLRFDSHQLVFCCLGHTSKCCVYVYFSFSISFDMICVREWQTTITKKNCSASTTISMCIAFIMCSSRVLSRYSIWSFSMFFFYFGVTVTISSLFLLHFFFRSIYCVYLLCAVIQMYTKGGNKRKCREIERERKKNSWLVINGYLISSRIELLSSDDFCLFAQFYQFLFSDRIKLVVVVIYTHSHIHCNTLFFFRTIIQLLAYIH